MKRILLLFCVGCFLFSCKSRKGIVTKNPRDTSKQVEVKQEEKVTPKVYANNTERYIDTHKSTAQQEMGLYGIPASITLAQGILESGSGKGRLSVQANNHFGIKCHEWTGKKIYHDDDKKQECFRKYKDAKYSFRDHSLFLTERKRYSKLFKLKKEDYKGWAKGLKAAGYATDRKYPQKLIGLVERYKLYAYDKEVMGDDYVKYDNPVTQERTTYKVLKGDTLYSISNTHNLTVNEFQTLTNLLGPELRVGQVLPIQPKDRN